MATMKAAVIVFPGINREQDMIDALTVCMGHAPVPVWHRDSTVPDTDLIVLPGGFSYGDYLRAGAMAARSPVMRDVVAKAEKGVPVLGVCNGFQILTEAGLLPGALMRNADLKFVCKEVRLKVEEAQTLFAGGYQSGQVIRVPVAHHDGNYFADEDTLNRMEDRGQIAFRYCDEDGALSPAANPNGSIRNIAGIYNDSKTVLGMMPHPENMIEPAQGGSDGLALFSGLVEALS
jgi:phosphoribosylformylglycinamidine synthase